MLFKAPSGALKLLARATPANVASVDFTGLDSTYEAYLLKLLNLVPTTTGGTLRLRSSTDGISFDAASGNYGTSILETVGTTPDSAWLTAGNGTGVLFNFGTTISNDVASGGISGEVLIVRPAGTTHNKQFLFRSGHPSAAGVYEHSTGMGVRLNTAAITAIRLLFGSNMVSGELRLYGVQK